MGRTEDVQLRRIVLALTIAALAADASATELLPPTGKYPIGRVTYVWRDTNRIDELATPPAPREVRVHVFYPAQRSHRTRTAPYHPDLELLENYADEHIQKNYLREDFGGSYAMLKALRGHALDHPPPAKSPRRFPIVVFSHGGGIQVLFYSAVLEELASHGYVVAAVEHPYDADLVAMPDGRVLKQKEWEHDPQRTPAERAAFHRTRHDVGARDNSFVLDQLARIHAGEIASPLRGRLDLDRAAAAGHSLGGMTSVASCATDRRFQACVNLDGGLDAGQKYQPTTQPLLALYGGPSPVKMPIETDDGFEKRRQRNREFLESAGHRQTVEQYSNAARGVLAYVISPGFSHFSYYDLNKPEAEPWGGTPERSRRNLEIIRDCLRTFLDATLRQQSASMVGAMRAVDAQLMLVPLGDSR
ncbi:MAG TPA: hypothetical protein VEK79_18825 [Thermoanaerobaculia bacterium]|nr:hypothetical protein [Thermoanaerobaculia bacterium]